MPVGVPIVVPVVQIMAWAQLVQWVVKDMIVAHGMVVIEGFRDFEKNVACFAAPFVATQI